MSVPLRRYVDVVAGELTADMVRPKSASVPSPASITRRYLPACTEPPSVVSTTRALGIRFLSSTKARSWYPASAGHVFLTDPVLYELLAPERRRQQVEMIKAIDRVCEVIERERRRD